MESRRAIGEPALGIGIIHIVESLETGRTGYRLYENLEPFAQQLKPAIPVRYWRTVTGADFKTTLAAIADQAVRAGNAPALHMECHGGIDGIETASKEFLAWADFRDEIIAINGATRMNLLVVLAACEGIWLLKSLQPTDRAAFATLIGPKRVVNTGEVEQACSAFYKSLLVDHEVGTALTAMNAAVGAAPNETFLPVLAQEAFRGVFTEYVRAATDEELERRVSRILASIDQRGMSQFERNIREGNLRRRLRDHRLYFEKFKERYFFIDQCPENADRFPLTYEDCIRDLER